jgi:hypothetical protein
MGEPITPGANGQVGQREQQAADAYRAKHPNGPPWLELHPSTQFMWMGHVASTHQAEKDKQ